MNRKIYKAAREKTLAYFQEAGIVLTEKEKENIEVADFGLNELEKTGLQLITYINTQRCCSKDLVLFPYQTCPEHRHPTIGEILGKEETFRCRYGKVFLFVEGEKEENPSAFPPKGDEAHYSVFKQIVLNPGERYTLSPDTLHWFQGGEKGAIVSEFSTASNDDTDIFSDPRIVRAPKVEE
ncbi:MAG: D-lyxose/D-mannose family sugar isomerase [Clostridiales bacterium]|nr:D-lyxose/D-mannose family sugar isomerase [Clostridiales bacterium]